MVFYRKIKRKHILILSFILLICSVLVAVWINGVKSTPSTRANGVVNAANDKNADVDEKRINELVSEMSLHEKICQMFIVTPEGLSGIKTVDKPELVTSENFRDYPVGGLVLFSKNLKNTEQTENMIAAFQSDCATASEVPLFIAVDEEGGKIARCAQKLGTTKLEPMYTYKSEGAEKAYDNAYTIAQDISSLGFNLDFAPVADTWSNKKNKVIGKRAYSDDFDEAAELVAAAVRGFGDGGVACSLKHFPGHGDTTEDSHDGTAHSYKTLAELEKQEYLAFESGIKAGADMVMVGHITMVNVDNMPASLSRTFMTDELRDRLGFEGVIVTDSLSMKAITEHYSSGVIAAEVIKAGGDILLMPEDLPAAVKAIEEAVGKGEITEDRINESVIRILTLKERRGILK